MEDIEDSDFFQSLRPCFKNEIDLLLIGKTGNGKSATGNSILGQSKFASEATCVSVTQDVDYEVVEFEDRKIKIVDGPGIGDTHYIDDLEQAASVVMDTMKNAVLLNPDGYHAFLLVIKYGNRLTAEDKECIRILKAIFGQEFIKNFCILVLTGGDIFRKNKIETAKTFKTWCDEQQGIFKELFTECSGRAVLFDNVSKDIHTRIKQVRKLVELVENLKTSGRRYTDKYFEDADKSRLEVMAQVKEPRIRQKALETISLILQKLSSTVACDLDKDFSQLSEILKEVNHLQVFVKKHDSETGVMKDTLKVVEFIQKRIQDNLCSLRIIYTEMEEMRQRQEEEKPYLDKNDIHMKLIENHKQWEEVKGYEKNIALKKREVLELLRSRNEKAKQDHNDEKRNVIKVMEKAIKEFWVLVSSESTDFLTKEEVEANKTMLHLEFASKLNEIENRQNEALSAIEKEGIEACKEVEVEEIVIARRLEEIEHKKTELLKQEKAEHEKMTGIIASIKDEFDDEMQHKIKVIESSNSEKLKEAMKMYNDLKREYDSSLKKKEKRKCIIL